MFYVICWLNLWFCILMMYLSFFLIWRHTSPKCAKYLKGYLRCENKTLSRVMSSLKGRSKRIEKKISGYWFANSNLYNRGLEVSLTLTKSLFETSVLLLPCYVLWPLLSCNSPGPPKLSTLSWPYSDYSPPQRSWFSCILPDTSEVDVLVWGSQQC